MGYNVTTELADTFDSGLIDAIGFGYGDEDTAQDRDGETARLERIDDRIAAICHQMDRQNAVRCVIGGSTQWRQVLREAIQVAPTSSTVLLRGESGTGKEVLARFIHRASARDRGPFVAVNCAALPEHLLEAELFGYERGAFTGATQSKVGQIEAAAGGTLLLDEIGEMSPSAQTKLLRVLQEREFQRLGGTRVIRADVRIIAATNRHLERAIVNGQFREDLFYRLNVFPIHLPALRDRRADILPLAEALFATICRDLGRAPAGISRDARKALTEHRWPGNVRELRNVLERGAILCDGGLLTAAHLALRAPEPAAPWAVVEQTVPREVMSRAATAADLEAMERMLIQDALQKTRFNKSEAARTIGLTRRQLYVRMQRYGIE